MILWDNSPMNKSSLLRSVLAGAYAIAAPGITLAQSSPNDPDDNIRLILPPPDGPKTYNTFMITCDKGTPFSPPSATAYVNNLPPEMLESLSKLLTRDPNDKERYRIYSGLIEKDGTLRPAENFSDLRNMFIDAVKNPEKLEGAPADSTQYRKNVRQHAETFCLSNM